MHARNLYMTMPLTISEKRKQKLFTSNATDEDSKDKGMSQIKQI